jgi:hypothetical protein
MSRPNVTVIVGVNKNIMFLTEGNTIKDIVINEEGIATMLTGLSPNNVTLAVDNSLLRMFTFEKDVNRGTIFSRVSGELGSTDLVLINRELKDKILVFALKKSTWSKLCALNPVAIVPLEATLLHALSAKYTPVMLKSRRTWYLDSFKEIIDENDIANITTIYTCKVDPSDDNSDIESFQSASHNIIPITFASTWKIDKKCRHKEYADLLSGIDTTTFNLMEDMFVPKKFVVPVEFKHFFQGVVISAISAALLLAVPLIPFHLPFTPYSLVVIPPDILNTLNNADPLVVVGTVPTNFHVMLNGTDIGAFVLQAQALQTAAKIPGSVVK